MAAEYGYGNQNGMQQDFYAQMVMNMDGTQGAMSMPMDDPSMGGMQHYYSFPPPGMNPQMLNQYSGQQPADWQQPQMFHSYPQRGAQGHNAAYNHYNGGQQHYHSAPTSPAYTLPSTSGAQQEVTASTGGNVEKPAKVYRHNPYAASCDSSTPTNSIPHSNSGILNSSTDNLMSPNTAAPIYDPAYVEGNVCNPITHQITEQFLSVVGNIPATSCSARGRHLLLSVIRLQHLDKIQLIFDELLPNMQLVLVDPHGCHVVRFLLEYLQDTHIALLCNSLSQDLILQMATASQHTRRILQTLFECHKTPELQYIVDVLVQHSYGVSTTQQGCIAMMRVIENCSPLQREQFLSTLVPQLAALAMDAYGNYVVQCVLQQYDRVTLDLAIAEAFQGQLIALSCNKFGSNVMEKVVGLGGPQLRDAILNELCFNEQNLHVLMQDGYGNFVLQALIEVTAGTLQGRKICDLVRPLLHSSPYGHKIEAKLRSKRLLGNAYNTANLPLPHAQKAQDPGCDYSSSSSASMHEAMAQ